MKRLYFILVLWIGKFGNVLCKIFHKSGTMISGKVAVKLQRILLNILEILIMIKLYL